ncbi:MAG: 3-dehydroquinate synthase [Chloroflexi bacterium]|nr:3-dehydroquinate synthase [Chloroflexota bacterium]
MNIILYGPPGAGKSTVGKELAARLDRYFVDSDQLIEKRAGRNIPQIFLQLGEAEFRRLESAVCAELAARTNMIIAVGGGALLNPNNRAALERSGPVICLRAEPNELLVRTASTTRPLLNGDNPAEQLAALLKSRRLLYDSFPTQYDTTGKSVAQAAEDIVALIAPQTLQVNAPGLEHKILLGYGLLESLPAILEEHGLTGPTLLVTDENIARHLPITTRSGQLPFTTLPAGEQHKTLDTVRQLYDSFLEGGLDRSGTVVAVGGGVLGDMAGFAAATFMRGLRWVNAPTTLLAMVDASLGGKTGVDLPQGKNLVGAFHPPSLVITDPLALNTLPEAERISGLAEVIKHGIIGDPALFESLEASTAFGNLAQLRRAIEVKVRVVEADPFEKGERAKLNLGHTIGHGVESASGYRLRHGEAVAIGLAAETWIAEQMGLAERGLAERVANTLKHAGLPTRAPGLDPASTRAAMSNDKKKAGGALKFALPKRLGEVAFGVEVDEALLLEALKAATKE